MKQYKAHTISNTFEGTLASKSGCHEVTDTITVYEPQEDDTQFYVTYDDTQEKSRSLFVEKCLEDKDQYTVFFGGNHPRVTIRTTSESGRRLLIFKDSYANSFIQFLTPYYEKIILVDPVITTTTPVPSFLARRSPTCSSCTNLNTYPGGQLPGDIPGCGAAGADCGRGYGYDRYWPNLKLNNEKGERKFRSPCCILG